MYSTMATTSISPLSHFQVINYPISVGIERKKEPQDIELTNAVYLSGLKNWVSFEQKRDNSASAVTMHNNNNSSGQDQDGVMIHT